MRLPCFVKKMLQILRSVKLQSVVGVSGEMLLKRKKKKILNAVDAPIPIRFSLMGSSALLI